MHACLRITETLDLIIKFLVDERVDNSNGTCAICHKDIARLIRCCKAFMDPALDVLWETQSSLSPLIMCLSGHFWTLEIHWSGRVVEPSYEDWLSLKRYSCRIRTFDHTTLPLPTVRPKKFGHRLLAALIS